MWAKSNDVMSPVSYMYRGIWVQCETPAAGQFSCDNFLRPIFSLSSLAIVQRCFAVMSLVFCSGSLILMIIGMECTKFYLKNPAKKVFLMKIAALVLFIGSFLLLLTASIYGKTHLLSIIIRIISCFFIPTIPQFDVLFEPSWISLWRKI